MKYDLSTLQETLAMDTIRKHAADKANLDRIAKRINLSVVSGGKNSSPIKDLQARRNFAAASQRYDKIDRYVQKRCSCPICNCNKTATA